MSCEANETVQLGMLSPRYSKACHVKLRRQCSLASGARGEACNQDQFRLQCPDSKPLNSGISENLSETRKEEERPVQGKPPPNEITPGIKTKLASPVDDRPSPALLHHFAKYFYSILLKNSGNCFSLLSCPLYTFKPVHFRHLNTNVVIIGA